jgi:hypothetical protein
MYLRPVKKGVKILFGIGLLFGAFFMFKELIRPIYMARSVTDSDEFLQLKNQWADMPIVQDEIVLIGNSLCVEYPHDSLAAYPITKMAMRGDINANLPGRIDVLKDRNPRMVIVAMGVNDVLSLGDFYPRGYEYFLEQASHSVDAEMVLMSISPVSFESGLFSNSEKANRKIIEGNILIQDMSVRYGATYLDVHSGLSENGELAKKFTYDGIHLTEEGYRIWEQQFNSLLEGE